MQARPEIAITRGGGVLRQYLSAIQQRRPRIAPVTTPGRSKQRMTRPTAAPEPVNYCTNQSKAMMVNWSPRYEMHSPSQSRWIAGWPNGAPTAVVS